MTCSRYKADGCWQRSQGSEITDLPALGSAVFLFFLMNLNIRHGLDRGRHGLGSPSGFGGSALRWLLLPTESEADGRQGQWARSLSLLTYFFKKYKLFVFIMKYLVLLFSSHSLSFIHFLTFKHGLSCTSEQFHM